MNRFYHGEKWDAIKRPLVHAASKVVPMSFSFFCNRYGTDKIKYAKAYEYLFGSTREEIKHILELGILDGASLWLWRSYFPNAEIVALDRYPYKGTFPGRCTTLIGDQEDPLMLQTLKKSGPYDMIIDDAGHETGAQKRSYMALKEMTRYYLVEDVTLSQKKEWHFTRAFESSRTKEYLLWI